MMLWPIWCFISLLNLWCYDLYDVFYSIVEPIMLWPTRCFIGLLNLWCYDLYDVFYSIVEPMMLCYMMCFIALLNLWCWPIWCFIALLNLWCYNLYDVFYSIVETMMLWPICITALVNTEDRSLKFLLQNPVDALLAIELSSDEFLLLFSGKWFVGVE